jgi:hypothetical protein
MSGERSTSIVADICNGGFCLLKPKREVACSILIVTHRKNGVASARQAAAELFHQWS